MLDHLVLSKYLIRPPPTQFRHPTLRLCRQCLHTSQEIRAPEALKMLENDPEPQIFDGDPEVHNVTFSDDNAPPDRPTSELRRYKPRTPGLRHHVRPLNDHLHKGRAYLPLTIPRRGHHVGGRNNSGKVTIRHRGAGAKRRIRIIDFSRMAPGRRLVERIEHDPGRSAHIALLSYENDPEEDGKMRFSKGKSDHGHNESQGKARSVREYSYIVAPQGLRPGHYVESFRSGIPRRILKELGGTPDPGMLAAKTSFLGNCLPLHMVPPGTTIFNIGLHRNGPAQLCRSAGSFATITGKNEGNPLYSKYVNVRLKSGEIRRIHREACATVGIASNTNHHRWKLGKAGRKRWLGIRPTVRGLAMNAFEHAHGGGRGKSKGNRQPVSIWGTLAKSGYKTRKRSKVNRAVITARPRNKDLKAKKTSAVSAKAKKASRNKKKGKK